jgi:hypothetical protein
MAAAIELGRHVVRDIVWTGVVVGVFDVLIHWWTGWLVDMACLRIPAGLIWCIYCMDPYIPSLIVSIKGSIREINNLLIGDPYRRWEF